MNRANIQAMASQKAPNWCHFKIPGEEAPVQAVIFTGPDEAGATGSSLIQSLFGKRDVPIEKVRIQHYQGHDIISVQLAEQDAEWSTDKQQSFINLIQTGLTAKNKLYQPPEAAARAFNTETARKIVMDNVKILGQDEADVAIDSPKNGKLHVRMGGEHCPTCESQSLTALRIRNALRQEFPRALQGVEISITVEKNKPTP